MKDEMSTLKISRHSDVLTALAPVKEEVGKEANVSYVRRVAKVRNVKLIVKELYADL